MRRSPNDLLVIYPRLVRGGSSGMEEYAVKEGVMWPLQTGGVSDLFHVWEERKRRHFSSLLPPMCWGKGWLSVCSISD